MFLRESRFSSQTSYVTVAFPRFQLPGTNYLLPLCPQEMRGKLVSIDRRGRFRQKLAYRFARRNPRMTEFQFVKASADRIHRMHFQAFRETLFSADKAAKLGPQSICQNVGERSQQDSRVRIRARKEYCAMERHDRLS